MNFYKNYKSNNIGFEDIYFYIYKNKRNEIGKYSADLKKNIKIIIIKLKNNYLEKNVFIWYRWK